MFVKRNSDGRILAVSREHDEELFPEEISNRSPELIAFLLPEGAESDGDSDLLLERSDASLIRVIEDLVDVLSRKGIIQFTDLPPQARRKLLLRKSLRHSPGDMARLLDDDDQEPLQFL